MSDGGPGCRKVGVVGCLGIFALILLAVGISAFWAWTIKDSEAVEEVALTGPSAADAGTSLTEPTDWLDIEGSRPPADEPVGRVVLELSQGGFRLWPGRPGEPTRVESTYDAKLYSLEESVESEGDLWVFTVTFRRKAPALVALFGSLMGAEEPIVDVYISPDEPIELVINANQGGLEAELGGLWLTRAKIDFKQGGGEITIDEPLRAPMESLELESRMGGFDVQGLANAAPRTMSVKCRMGGAELDFDGEWLYDADVRIDVSMGGVEIALPSDVNVEGIRGRRSQRLRTERSEIPEVTLRFDVKARMGGVETR